MTISTLRPLLLLALGTSFACTKDDNNGGGDGGSTDTDDIRHMGSYGSMNNKTDAGVELVEPDDRLDVGDVMVVCDSGSEGDIEATVSSSGELVLDFGPGATTALGCTVHVVADGLTGVTNDGDGDVFCGHPLFGFKNIEVNGNGNVHVVVLEANVLDLYVTGNGALDIDSMTVNTTRIDLRGTGDITLAGETVDAELSVSGNGNLWAQGLTVTDTLDADLSGNGSAVITVLGTVNASVSGNGNLEIYGGASAGEILGDVIFH